MMLLSSLVYPTLTCLLGQGTGDNVDMIIDAIELGIIK